MSLVVQIKIELNQLGIRPKKSLGQNFLINEGIYHKIVAALEIKPDDIILEIGSGLGTLTEFLVETGPEIIAVEKDRKLAEYLKIKFANNNRVTILEEDVLKFDIRHSIFDIRNYKIVGNIPYYLTSHLLRVVFEQWPQPEMVVLMLQKEVAQRITAKPPKMSLLAVSVQYYAEPKIVSHVSRKSFWPEPNVDSALIRLSPKFQIRNPKKEHQFFKIVKAGFAGKRKQLGNNLARGLGMPKGEVEEKLQSVEVDPKRRAETLTLEEWQNLAERIMNQES